MTQQKILIDRLQRFVETVSPLHNQFIFLGGSVVPLLVTDEAAPEARNTLDIDVVVNVISRTEYEKITDELKKVDFHHDMTSGITCRFKHQTNDLILDVMPTDEEILKMGNRWYKLAAEQNFQYLLTDTVSISVINPDIFLCTKFDAYSSRGKTDHKDLSDIVSVIDGRSSLLHELRKSDPKVKDFLSDRAKELIENDFYGKLDWCFRPEEEARKQLVVDRFKEISTL